MRRTYGDILGQNLGAGAGEGEEGLGKHGRGGVSDVREGVAMAELRDVFDGCGVGEGNDGSADQRSDGVVDLDMDMGLGDLDWSMLMNNDGMDCGFGFDSDTSPDGWMNADWIMGPGF